MPGPALMGGGAGLGVPDVVVSTLLHLVLVGTLAATRSCTDDDEPLFDPDEIMEVQMVALPKSAGRNPDRATRAPAPAVAAPAPDTMTYQDPSVEKRPTKEHVKEQQAKRDELLRQLKRESLIRSLSNAPVGSVDRGATDPDSTLEGDVWGSGVGVITDPELARYLTELRQAVIPQWAPLPRLIQENPGLEADIFVWLDDLGVVQTARVGTSSGNSSFDESCLRAVRKAGRLPIPPAKYRVDDTSAFGIRFRASDAK